MDERCGYRLGSVAGFRGKYPFGLRVSRFGTLELLGELSFEHSIVLRALGPRCVSVTDTKLRRLDGDLASFINSGILLSRQQELKIGTLMEDRLGLMEHLQKNQAFTFSPSDSDRVYVYAVDNTTTTASGADDGDLCQKVPFVKQCGKQAETVCEKNFLVDEAMTALGGLKLFVFLFARVSAILMAGWEGGWRRLVFRLWNSNSRSNAKPQRCACYCKWRQGIRNGGGYS